MLLSDVAVGVPQDNMHEAAVTHRRLSSRIIMPAGLMGQVAWWASSNRHGNAPERARILFLVGRPTTGGFLISESE